MTSGGKYDLQKPHDVTKVVTHNLNRIIDRNYYPVPEARRSNTRHRPIGLGVQGLADTFMALRMPFDPPTVKELNIQIFETIYHAACEASMEMAIAEGPHERARQTRASSSSISGVSRRLVSGTGPS